MRAFAIHRGEKHGELAGRILCQDVRGVFRKGHVLRPEDVPVLIDAAWTELHLIEPEPDDVPQREAGERLAAIVCSAGLEIVPKGHRHVLRAQHKGLLKIDVSALHRLNSIPGIAVFTLTSDAVVSPGQIVTEAQITPLAIDRKAIDDASRERNVVRVLPFQSRDVVILKRDDRALRALNDKLQWFGCEIREVVSLSSDARSIRDVIERHTATLFIVSGSNALDPLDPVFVALEDMGAQMQRLGMPVHPGTLLWIASKANATIIGLPSCGLGPQVTGFDLVLPKLLAVGSIRDEDFAALGHGGILNPVRTS